MVTSYDLPNWTVGRYRAVYLLLTSATDLKQWTNPERGTGTHLVVRTSAILLSGFRPAFRPHRVLQPQRLHRLLDPRLRPERPPPRLARLQSAQFPDRQRRVDRLDPIRRPAHGPVRQHRLQLVAPPVPRPQAPPP